MSITTQLSLAAARLVVSGACKATGLPDAGGKAIDFLVERFTDQSRRLPEAIDAATERAWKTLELTLAGDSLWGKLTTRGEDYALAQELRAASAAVSYDESLGSRAAFFEAALKELRAARKAPTFTGGALQPDELRRHCRAVANYADPTALLEAEWQSATWIGELVRGVSAFSISPNSYDCRSGELPFLDDRGALLLPPGCGVRPGTIPGTGLRQARSGRHRPRTAVRHAGREHARSATPIGLKVLIGRRTGHRPRIPKQACIADRGRDAATKRGRSDLLHRQLSSGSTGLTCARPAN